MKEKDLKIDTSCHAIYTKQCKNIVLNRIKMHYSPNEVDEVFEKVQHQYEAYLNDFDRRDLGGDKNFHNKKAGTYDCIFIICYYIVCNDKTNFEEIQTMAEELSVGNFKSLNFVKIDKPFFKRLMYAAFKGAEKKCAKWHDYEMHLDPYSKDKPLHYCFTRCPFADFIHQFKLEDIAGALCNVNYAAMKAMNIALVRRHTCIEGDHCDYTFYSPTDPVLKNMEEYIDEKGFIRNK